MSYESPGLKIKLVERIFFFIAKKLYKNSAKALKLQGNEKILEFGSGGGQLTTQMQRYLGAGSEIYCLDISEYWQKIIRKRLKKYKNVKYRLRNLMEEDLDEKDFDLVVLHLAFHHLKDSDKLVVAKKFYELLKPGGKLFLREPNGKHHNKNVNSDAMKKIILNCGFKLITEAKQRILIDTFTQVYEK